MESHKPMRLSIEKISNGYIITFPTGGVVQKNLSDGFFTFGSSEIPETAQWYVQTKAQLEHVLSRIVIEHMDAAMAPPKEQNKYKDSE